MDEQENYLRLKDVAAYVYERTGLRVARATVYNWVTKGRVAYDGRKIVLKTKCSCPVRITTEKWIDEFMQEFQSVT